MNLKNNYKALLSEVLLVSSLLVVNSCKNDKALEENIEAKITTQRVYEQLEYDVKQYKKLVGFNSDGSFIFDEFETIEYIAPEGYKIDYIKQLAYKDISVTCENTHADKIYEREVISNNTNCILNIGLGSSLIYLINNKIKKLVK